MEGALDDLGLRLIEGMDELPLLGLEKIPPPPPPLGRALGLEAAGERNGDGADALGVLARGVKIFGCEARGAEVAGGRTLGLEAAGERNGDGADALGSLARGVKIFGCEARGAEVAGG